MNVLIGFSSISKSQNNFANIFPNEWNIIKIELGSFVTFFRILYID